MYVLVVCLFLFVNALFIYLLFIFIYLLVCLCINLLFYSRRFSHSLYHYAFYRGSSSVLLGTLSWSQIPFWNRQHMASSRSRICRARNRYGHNIIHHTIVLHYCDGLESLLSL